jgi:SPOR domain
LADFDGLGRHAEGFGALCPGGSANIAVKVTSGIFLLGLSAVESEKERNVQLLKERAWFDFPVVYNDGSRAIIAIENGDPGERAFSEGFKAWEQAKGGGYVVQVASQRTETDVQGSYRILQARYPNVLGSRRASIRRADLGERGVYYRAYVGPFASVEEAGAMCDSLKHAGEQCIVQRNWE